MKSRMTKLKGTARQFEIEMPKEKVEEALNRVLEDIRKTAKIPGFRPGKAPLDIIRKSHYEDAVDEVKRRLIPQAYQRALEEHNISPVSYPEVSDVSIGPSGTLTFKARVDTHPRVNIRKYKGLRVVTHRVRVSDEEVQEVLMQARNMNAEFVETDRTLQKGDFGICDVEVFMGEKPIARKRENVWIEVDKEASMLGMGEELCGLRKGESRDIEVTLPETYPDKKYAGKKAVFHVKVKETREKSLPELNDELARKLGKDTLSEVREEIRTQLMERKVADARVAMKNQILEQLLKEYPLELPESMVNRQLKVLMERVENELAQKGIDRAEIDSHKEKLKGQLLKEAEDKVRAYFLLDEIASREKIEINTEELNKWLESLAATYNQSVDTVMKYYQDHDLMDGLREQLREEKTLDFLLSEAAITEK